LQQAFAGHRISVKGQTRDGSKALLLTSSDRNPGGQLPLLDTTLDRSGAHGALATCYLQDA
jgi:hypothetical protein